MSIEERKKYYDQRLVEIVKCLIVTNGTNFEIANTLGLTKSTVNKNIINQERIISLFDLKENEIEGLPLDSNFDSYGEFIWNEVRKRKSEHKERGKQKSKYKEFYQNKVRFEPLINLEELYATEDKQYSFLTSSALTFRLDLETLSRLVGKDVDTVSSKVFYYRGSLEMSLKYLFYYENNNQEVALQNFLIYYQKLILAKKNGNKKELEELIKVIGDGNVKQILAVPSAINTLLDKEIDAIIEYQLKYSLSNAAIRRMFHFDVNNYVNRAKERLLGNPVMESRMNQLIEYYKTKSKLG